MDLKTLLKKELICIDGAMGTVLQSRGLKPGGIPEALNIEDPALLTGIHKEYISAGADIIYANTFGANRYKLAHSKYSVNEIISAGIENARRACENTGTLAALDIGPIGQLLEPTGTLTFEEAYDIYKEMILAGSGADIVVFETMTDLYELKAALLAAKENSDKPVICTMTFEENMRTFTGCRISSMALVLEGLGADAVGINCSLGPEQLYSAAEELCRCTSLPVVIKPNAGLPDPVTGKYDIDPKKFAELMEKLIPLGVKIFGGCCGTTPDFIRELKTVLDRNKYRKPEVNIPAACCTPSQTVYIDRPRIKANE